MTINIAPQKALEKIDEFLGKVEELKKLSYKNGKIEKTALESKIDGFISAAFQDAKERRSKYIGFAFAVVGHVKTEEELQESYLARLNSIDSTLNSWKTEIELTQSSSKITLSLDKADQEIQDAQKEAIRRGFVVESKVSGALIELIDRLRAQIKEKDLIGKELISINQNLEEIKQLLKNKN